MKYLLQYTYRYCAGIIAFVALSQTVCAQTESDAIMIPKNYLCIAGMYAHNNWDHYWEGTLKRENLNLGTISSNIYNVGAVYGLSNRINVSAFMPYIQTKASAGTLRGQRGFQDINLAVKWMAVREQIGRGLLSFHAIASGSIPVGNYQGDYLPFALGSRSKSIAIRGLVNYQIGRFFVAGAGQYIRKDNITIDRDAYYTTEMHYTNQVALPNATNFLVSAGFRSLLLNVEAIATKYTTLGGFDITRNNMPFPSNRMNATAVGGLVKYMPQTLKGLEFTLGSNYVVAGRNVGQNLQVMGGVDYVFSVKKEKK
ncbi:hypothetical protein IDJ77_19560 [Mucilaginibacter sp. ZT4R22]|uniref:Outer membrane beta-barrel porin/alpha-amylase n=1 Tax=Mucilaginibacter pankratovii TaxID=2772110 RepID=A0ABR7WUP0_9SPHI|nr:hypothetical protein [Mucilaginibacter pankratovii]MBD1366020.1 hypothetical protein [Mucilaginibacter pankratovii]